MRTVPLGQSDGQIALAALKPTVRAGGRGGARRRPRSTRSARPRRCSTGARCATRPSTRGCSAHDRAARLPPVRGRWRARRHPCPVGPRLATGPRPARRRWRAASSAMAAGACRPPCLLRGRRRSRPGGAVAVRHAGPRRESWVQPSPSSSPACSWRAALRAIRRPGAAIFATSRLPRATGGTIRLCLLLGIGYLSLLAGEMGVNEPRGPMTLRPLSLVCPAGCRARLVGDGRDLAAASEPALARAVIGDGRIRMPPPWQCAGVALVLAAVAPGRGWSCAGRTASSS